MVTRVRTIDFLPEIFRTKTNEQFLSATLDQLVQQPNTVKVQGYIGSKFGYGVNTDDKYVVEKDNTRNNYQLEPAVVFKKPNTDVVYDFLTYSGLIDALKHEGGVITDQSKLFTNQFYSWDSFADLDKLVNYGQYYWLPLGPESVQITNTATYRNVAYNVTSNINVYDFTADSVAMNTSNPTITLMRGGKYTFIVNQDSPFYIQGVPGLSGLDIARPNVSTRDIFGLDINGISNGVMTFTVPMANAQDGLNFPGNVEIDLVTRLSFSDIHGKRLADLQSIDGITSLEGKTLLFYGVKPTDTGFINRNFYDSTNFDDADPQVDQFEEGSYTTLANNIYIIKYLGVDGDIIVTLEEYASIPNNQKITVNFGEEFVQRNLVKPSYGDLYLIPYISSSQTTLYYQDGVNEGKFGKIKLLEQVSDDFININVDVVGQKTYTSPNGVTFTNGLKVNFTGNIVPTSYLSGSYYVEGVGSSINLIPVDELVVTEPFTSSYYTPYETTGFDADPFGSALFVPSSKDYITINRNSNDRNAWSRSNRWFHHDVLQTTIKFTPNSPISQSALNNNVARANRPIIEFYPNLKLFNHGVGYKAPVDYIDLTTTDAFTDVSGQETYFVDGSTESLFDGARIIFANDNNPQVRNKIFIVSNSIVQTNSVKTITLSTATDGDVQYNEQVIVTKGAYGTGKSFYFDGSNWVLGQQKVQVNQSPMFDIFDSNGISFGDQTYYQGSDFFGCTLFQYAVGTGTDDPVLGIPLAYSSVSNIGDISFDVTLNSQSFNFVYGNLATSLPLKYGYVYQYTSVTDYTRQLGWQTAVGDSFQYQIFDFKTNSTGKTKFICDVAVKDASTTPWPTVIVYLNNSRVDSSVYTLTVTDTTTTVTIPSATTTSTIQILLYSDQVSKTAYYEVPSNLENNPFNNSIDTVNMGDLRGHYKSICNNITTISGYAFGPNNFRDLGNLVPYGTRLIQNSGSLIIPALFTRNSDNNLFNALSFNAIEYNKFKSVLINSAEIGDYSSYQTTSEVLDDILNQFSSIRSQTNPFFWSDMVPAKSPSASNSYTFKATATTVVYPTTRIYDFTVANYYSVLVYLSRIVDGVTTQIQLIRDIDYIVSATEAKITVNATLVPGDIITINEYNQTYGSFVPNTPTKVGLYSKTVPTIIVDETYLTPTYFIVGHDGSYTKLYGEYIDGQLVDIRDKVLFEYECRVYNNLKCIAKIPIVREDIMPGQFRTTDFNYDEVQQIYSTQFLNWIGQNRIDYKSQFYSVTNPLTWNYNLSKSKLNGSNIKQGNWRGLYLWYYDTTRPHTAPWEMLGFSSEPLWWNKRYGPAPYTSENTLLWTDLANGYNYNDGNPEILPARIRAGLLDCLPVDTMGNLLTPDITIIGETNTDNYNRNWKVGDIGPAEYSYLKSSSWPFDLMRIFALTQPGKFFTQGLDLDVYRYNAEFNQYLVFDRLRTTPAELGFYGGGTGLSTDLASGYAQHSFINWIVDYQSQFGINGNQIVTDLIKNCDVKLTYRVAGFTDKSMMKFYIEKGSPNSKNSSLLIPDESYSVLLYNNQAFDRITYSGVIVQRTTNGYAVYGNSQDKAYFKTFTPKFNGNYDPITVNNLTINISRDFSTTVNTVPYGTEYTSIQGLSEFVLNYGRYLEAQGLIFDSLENGLEVNWKQMIAELMYWVQSGWDVGSTININPAAKTLAFNKDNSIIQPLTLVHQNYVLNQDLIPIQMKDLSVYRNGSEFRVSALNDGDTISYFVADVSNLEHAVIFNNTTVFNDRIYNLVTGLRQQRLMLKGIKTDQWSGVMDAQGFIFNQDNVVEWQQNVKYTKGIIVKHKNSYWTANSIIQPSVNFSDQDWVKTDYEKIQKGLLPNASNRAYESTLYYDSHKNNLTSDADLLSFSLIGYRPRDYLEQANLVNLSQFNLFKNMLPIKGTMNSADMFQNATLPQGTVDYSIYENWAIKSGEYGGILNQNYIEFNLNQNKVTGNPFIVALTNGEDVNGSHQQVPIYSLSNYGRNIRSSNILSTLSDYSKDTEVLRTAGYANFDDMRVSAYTYNSLTSADVNSLYKNDYVWVANYKNDWDVYSPVALRNGNESVNVTDVLNNLDGTVTIYFNNHHGLAKDDLFGILNFNTAIDGFYVVKSVLDLSSVVVSLTLDPSKTVITSLGMPFILQSHRLLTPSDIYYLPLLDNEFFKNKVWIDYAQDGNWAVYEKSINYQVLPVETSLNTTKFGSSVAYHPILGYFVADIGHHVVYRMRIDPVTGASTLLDTLSPLFNHPTPYTYGTSIVIQGDILMISQPDDFGTNSYIWIYKLVNEGFVQRVVYQQFIWIAGGGIGSTLELSGDTNYLYASASSYGGVTVFQKNVNDFIDTTGISLSHDLNEGQSYFVVSGNHVADLPVGEKITFEFEGTGKQYMIVTSRHNSGDNTTTFYLTTPVESTYLSGSSIFTASINYTFVGAFGPGVDASVNFGETIATDYTGKMVFVGAPDFSYSVSQTHTGLVFSWERLVESWEVIADSPPYSFTVFLVSWNTTPSSQLFINGVKLDPAYYLIYPINASTSAVILGPTVYAGDKITISSANFVEKQVLSAYDNAEEVCTRARFSTGMDANVTGADLLVGAPFFINSDGSQGNVYRFINEGKKYGVITGLQEVALEYATDVLINEYRVSIPAGNAASAAEAINNAGINNVIALTAPNSNPTKSSDRNLDVLIIGLRDPKLGPVNNKLTLTVFNGNDLYYLGISEYTKTEILNNPHGDTNSQYGSTIQFNEQNSFIVSAPTGNRFEATFIDYSDDENNHNDTVFDNNFTQFVDNFVNAGAVYMYDYLPGYNENLLNSGKYVYSQSLNDVVTAYGTSPRYGQSLFFRDGKVIIGTPNFNNTGRVVVYDNTTNAVNWKIYRQSNPVVNIDKIQKVQLYDNTTNTVIDSLDYIDPVQGKLLGAVRENIDYMVASDPADYNNTNASKGSVVWGKEHVGMIWFDTSNTRFINYHQNDIVYDSKYWGKIFPGSSVTVYTWVESDVTPTFYAGSGTPYDIELYTSSFVVDSNNSLVSKYYFWVRNTNTISSDKTLSDTIIEQYIRDPQSSGIPYLAPYNTGSFGLYNVLDMITHNTNLYIGYSVTNLENSSHSKYELIRDGHAEDFISGIPSASNTYAEPVGLYLKLLDSFAGLDSQGSLVPDPSLPLMLRIGISTKPSQSLFLNRLKALENYLTYANSIMALYPIAEFKKSNFLSMTGDTFDTTMYWSYVNWYAPGYDSNTKPVVQVDKYFQLRTVKAVNGTIVGVKSNSDGRKETYLYTNGTWDRIALENGTIQFSSILWDYADNGLGNGNNFFDIDSFDAYPATETRNIIRALNEELYVGDLQKYRNESLILMFEYIQSENIEENNYLPWLNKTSFIDVANTVRELVPLSKYQQDDDKLVEGFLNEVKPYHVVIKDFYLRYTGSETYDNGITDFDLPVYYNSNDEKFYSPQLVLENPLNGQYLPTDPIWNSNTYSEWFNNFGLQLNSTTTTVIGKVVKYMTVTDNVIYIDNSYGVPIQGLIKVDDELIGYTSVDRINGILKGLSRGVAGTAFAVHYPETLIYSDLPGVIIVSSGRAYIDPPQIKAIVDTTKYPAPTKPADLVAIMSGEHVVGVKVNDPGEGYVVSPEIYIEPSIVVKFNESQMNFNNNTILLDTDKIVSGDLMRFVVLPEVEGGVEVAETNNLNGLIPEAFYYIRVITTLSAAETVVGLPRTLVTLHAREADVPLGHNPINIYWNEDPATELLEDPAGMEYALELAAKAISVTKNTRVRELTTVLKYDRTSYSSNIEPWSPGQFWPSPFNSLGNDASSDTNLSSPAGYAAAASFQGAVLWINGVSDDEGTAVAVVDYSHSEGLTPAQVKGLRVFFYKTFDAVIYDASAAEFTATISGNTMTVTNIATGVLAVGQRVSGGGLASDTVITSVGTTRGLAPGVYTINNSVTIATSTLFESTGGAKIKIYRPKFEPHGVTNQYYVVLLNTGSIYNDGDQIIIPGSLLGGVDGLNNCVVSVVFTNNHVITLFETTGISVGHFATYYVKPISDTQLKIYSDQGLKIPVLYNDFDFSANDYAYVPEPLAVGQSYKYIVSALVTYENVVYRCLVSNSDLVFDHAKWAPLASDDRALNALDRILGFYEPTNSMPGKNLLELVQGITYPNTVYRGNSFALADTLPLDFVVQDQPFYPRDINITAIIYDGSRYVAAADTKDHSIVLISNDIVTWNTYKISNKVLGLTGITFAETPSYFVSSITTANPILMSFDIANWETLGEYTPYDVVIYGRGGYDSTSIKSPKDTLYGIAYVNGTYLAVGNEILRSNDGISWESAFSFGSRLPNILKAVTYTESAYFAGYIAVGYGQRVVSGNDTANPIIVDVGHIVTCVDDITWNLQLPATTHVSLNTVTSSFNLILVAGDNGTAYVSINCSSWILANTSGSSANLNASIFAHGKFVLVGDDGTILTANDVSAEDIYASGIHFTLQTSGTTYKLNTITHNGTYFVAAGEHGTILRSTDAVTWIDVSYIETKPPYYDIKGDAFDAGYGPEELVAGIIDDNLSLTVTTKPGSFWDNDVSPETTYGYTGFNMKTVSGSLDLSLSISFDNLVINPAQLSVFVVDKTTGLSTRIYENVVNRVNSLSYTIDWINKIVTLNQSISDSKYVLVEVYEIGNGRQIARTNSQLTPLRYNSETQTSQFVLSTSFIPFGAHDITSITYEPVIYHNGSLLLPQTDYNLLFTNTGSRIVFNDLYDSTDYITFALFDYTIDPENNPSNVYGYSIPETEVFVYSGSNTFTLSNYSGGDNSTNAIVELNGARLARTSDYTLVSGVLTIIGGLVTHDIIAVTTFHDTKRQYLHTDTVSSRHVTPIYYVDHSATPVIVVMASDPGLTNGDVVRLDGIVGSDQLNNTTHYAKVLSTYVWNGTTYHPIELYEQYTPSVHTFSSPVSGSNISPYMSGGYIWKDNSTFTVTQTISCTDGARTWVTINGKRVDPNNLRFHDGTKLNIMAPIATSDLVIVTSMISTVTPNEEVFNIIVDKTGAGNVYKFRNDTWLTKPLYLYEDTIYVNDARNLVSNIVEDVSVTTVDDMLVTYLTYSLNDLSGIIVYNKSSLTMLERNQYKVRTINGRSTVIFTSGVSDGHILEVTVQIGHILQVNGELIRFDKIDYTTNSVSGLMRGLRGTGILPVHNTYDRVYRINDGVKLEHTYYTTVWNSNNYTTAGDPLQLSNTAPANFLKTGVY